jgi:hypothetical protein
MSRISIQQRREDTGWVRLRYPVAAHVVEILTHALLRGPFPLTGLVEQLQRPFRRLPGRLRQPQPRGLARIETTITTGPLVGMPVQAVVELLGDVDDMARLRIRLLAVAGVRR